MRDDGLWQETSRTAALCRDAGDLEFLKRLWILAQTLERMERAANLERADALQVLALEPQTHSRSRWCAPLPLRALELILRPCCRRQLRQRAVCEDRRAVHMRLDQLVRLDN